MRAVAVVSLIVTAGCGRVGFDREGLVTTGPDGDVPPATDPMPVGSEDLPAPAAATSIADVAISGDRVIATGPGGTAIYERTVAGTWLPIDFPYSGTEADIDNDLACVGWDQGIRILDRRSGAWVEADSRDGFGVRGLGAVYVRDPDYRVINRFDNDPGTEVELRHWNWDGNTWGTDPDEHVLLVPDGPVGANATVASHRGAAVISTGTHGVFGAAGVTATTPAENSIALWSGTPKRVAVGDPAAERVVIWEEMGAAYLAVATIDAPVAGAGFGDAVAFVGPHIVAIGAPGEDTGEGAVYTFGETAAGWTLGERIVAGPVGLGATLDGGADFLLIAGQTSPLLRRVQFASNTP